MNLRDDRRIVFAASEALAVVTAATVIFASYLHVARRLSSTVGRHCPMLPISPLVLPKNIGEHHHHIGPASPLRLGQVIYPVILCNPLWKESQPYVNISLELCKLESALKLYKITYRQEDTSWCSENGKTPYA
jgi:hypothetical protein